MDNTLIRVRGLTKKYRHITALSHIDVNISKGEIFGVVGPNGAGKSTLLSILATVIKPSSGEFYISNYSSNRDLKSIRRIIGYVPQEISLYTTLSGLDNLKFWAGLYGIKGKARDKKIFELVELTHLGERIKDKVETYSGGMKRRINIATALTNDPQVLLMDEPTVGMDSGSRKLMIETFNELKRQGKTIVFSSHYMDELEHSCDRAMVLDDGVIKAMGTLQDIKRFYEKFASEIYI